MEITITWTKIIVTAATYFTGRYLYFSYMKWVTACDDPFDPTVYYRTSSYTNGWDMGYRHGTKKMRAEHTKRKKELTELKDKYRKSQEMLSNLENSLPD